MQNMAEYEYLNALDEYEAYVKEWKKTHNYVPGREEPACFDEWFDYEYQEGEE